VRDEVDSTNNLAKEYAAGGAKEGFLVVSKEQAGGRGRLGKRFCSPKESGIYMSVILRPALKAQDSVFITAAAAVAVCRAIERTAGVVTQIKWVNDICAGGKKLCGILTEAVSEVESGGILSVVLGIGVNTQRPQNGYPPEIERIATSVKELNPVGPFSKNQLIAEILNQFEPLYTALEKKEYMDEYKSRSCIIGREIEILQNGGNKTARVIGIDDNAMLVAREKDGSVVTLHSGEISIRQTLRRKANE
jgi:BirA family biotin operon repressor/biotin-[acetyl-CoA-carboxylase] ligase